MYRKGESMKRAASLILILALVLTLSPGAARAASAAYGSEVWLQDTALQDGAVLSDNIYWSDYYGQLRHEYYITYTPGRQVTAAAAYGASVCDRLTGSAAAQAYEAMGYRVVGAINGDFYDTATGYPLGLLVSQGELLSGSANYYALGIKADGSVVMGQPSLAITAQSYGQSLTLAAINKPRVENGGVTLLTYDFRSDHTTGTTTAGVSALCSIVGGGAAIGGELLLRVEQVVEDTAALAIQEGQVVLTTAATGYAQGVAFLRALLPGQDVSVSFTTTDPSWSEVTEAIGALHLLVSGGAVQGGLDLTYAPRTAVGLKANGDLVLYTVDGRQTGHSMGASLKVLAERMVELGCVTALCLDGGGSTTAMASLPSGASASLINSPSDKAQRKVSNHLLLLSQGYPSGRADHVYLSASAPAVLAGHTVELTANLVDSNYFPMEGAVTLSASAGEIAGTTFTAPQQGGPVTITASASGMTASVEVLVVETPDQMTVLRDGSAVSSMTLVPGDKAELTATVTYNHLPLETKPGDFLWTVDPALGTIDENGVLTTAYTEGSGSVTASKGGMTVSVPLKLDGASPFADTQGHWGVAYMASLYHKGVFTGVTVEDKLYAYPDRGVSRMEFAVLLARYLGLNAADYASVEVPFADMDTVDAWAADSVRAMYALGIVGGTTVNGQQIFNPRGTLTRAEAVTMLGRLRARMETESVPPADLSQFADASAVPDYALEHFQTMVALGVVGGDGGKLAPGGTMTRAAVCKVLATLP